MKHPHSIKNRVLSQDYRIFSRISKKISLFLQKNLTNAQKYGILYTMDAENNRFCVTIVDLVRVLNETQRRNVMKRFAELQTSLNARPNAARTFTRSVDTAPHLKPPYYTAVNPRRSRREDELEGHFHPVPGGKYPISEWPYVENLRAAKARLPAFCTRAVHARHSLHPSDPLAPRRSYRLGTAPRGFSHSTAPTQVHR